MMLRLMTLSTVSVFNIMKNPTILLALVSMGLFLGMPYLLNNSMGLSHPTYHGVQRC